MKYITKLISGLTILALLGMSTASAIVQVRDVSLIVNGSFESGATGWTQTAVTASVVAKATEQAGTQAIRVAQTGLGGAYLNQSIMTAGATYTVKGFYRADGVAGTTARILLGNTTICFSGVATTWTPFSCTATQAGNLEFYIGVLNGAGGGWAEFDNVSITRHFGTVQNRDVNLATDGNMEAVGTTSWSSTGLGASTTTKETGAYNTEGKQILKIAYSTTITPAVQQNGIFEQGKRYRVRGCVAGDGVSGYPFVIIGNAQTIYNGAPSSTTPTCFDTTITSTSTQTSLRLYCYNCTAVGHYSTYDNISVNEVKGTVQNRDTNISVNGNYEAGTTGLTNGNGTVSSVSKFEPSADGSLALRITYNSNLSIAWAYATIANLVATDSPVHVYRIRGMARGDGTIAPTVTRTNNGGANCSTIWTGTNSTATQYFDVTFNNSSCSNKIGLGGSSNAAGYVEFDNVTHTRVY